AAVGATNIAIPSGVNTPNRVVVYALAGDDTVNAGTVTSFPVELIGGAGSDTLTGGTQDDVLLGNNPGDYALGFNNAANDKGNDSLTGGAGNDTLDGGLGNDTMSGGVGSDNYIETPGSDDVLTEAAGSATDIDSIDFSQAYYGIVVSL